MTNKWKHRLGRFLGLAVAGAPFVPSGMAVQPSPLFSDHAVLQAGKPVPVWGTGSPGEKITIRFLETSASATVDGGGQWKTELPALKEGMSGELIFEGANKVVSQDVLVGDVWLCSGQSNMEWIVSRSLDAEKELAAANHPQIRHFKVAHVSVDKPAMTLKGQWVVCSPANVGNFSAVGYFFATYLSEKLQRPIGLLDVSWGGSPIETWLSAEALDSSPQEGIARDRWNKYLAGEYPELKKAYEERMKGFKERKSAAEKAGTAFRESNKPPDSPGTQKALSGAFNGVVSPVIPYALKGILWYQGEHNTATFPEEYAGHLAALAADWRGKWNDSKLPFFYVQLANYRGSRSRPTAWAILREQQQKANASIPNSALTTAVDIGDPESVHPTNKREVGRRLALIAFDKVYDMPQISSGPVFKERVAEGAKVRLKFETFGSGLVLREPSATGPSFEVCGEDKVFLPATAVVAGEEVVLQSDRVSQPLEVRYLWSNTPAAILFNKEGLPAFPFRTDNWPEPVKGGRTVDPE